MALSSTFSSIRLDNDEDEEDNDELSVACFLFVQCRCWGIRDSPLVIISSSTVTLLQHLLKNTEFCKNANADVDVILADNAAVTAKRRRNILVV